MSSRYLLLLFAVTLLFGTHPVRSQSVTASVANVMKYGNGNEMSIFGIERKEFVENISDLRLGFDKLRIGLRLELSDPPEFGLPYRGVRKKYVEYSTDGLMLRAGDLYALFNKGTSLNLFENRTLAFDTGVEGVLAEYRTSWLRAVVVSGAMDFVDPLTIANRSPRHETYSLRGALAEFTPVRFVSFGASMVSATAGIPNAFTLLVDDIKGEIPELFVSLRTEPIDFFASYTLRNVWTSRDIRWKEGSALYSSLSHSGEGYGVTLEYKDYRFDIVDPSGADPFRLTRMMPFQNPPTVKKEHSYTSLSRSPHIVDFNDEVGMQMEIFYQPTEGTTLSVGGSMASRHYRYILDRLTFISSRTEEGSTLLPSLHPSRSPFWEITADLEHFIDAEGSYVKGGFDRRYDYTFFEFGSTSISMTGIPVTAQWMIDDEWSIKATVENQWINHSAYISDNVSYDLLFSIQLSRSPEWTIGVRREATTNPFEPSHRSIWIAVDGSYRLGTAHTIAVTYGDERGGQICTNGICRQINPFSGFRFSMISQL